MFWGLGIGDWGLGPIPNPQSPIPTLYIIIINNIIIAYNLNYYQTKNYKLKLL